MDIKPLLAQLRAVSDAELRRALQVERLSITADKYTTAFLPEDSPLRPFRDIFRAGCSKQGDDTLAQHIRNSLAHGTFEIAQHKLEISFEDRNWTAEGWFR